MPNPNQEPLPLPVDICGLTMIAVRQYLSALRPTSSSLRIPAPLRGDRSASAVQHAHLVPEIFIQLAGYTDFTCGKERFRLNPGEVCIMPGHTPHAEIAGSLDGKPFHNIVMTYGRSHLIFHDATAVNGKPRVASSGSVICRTISRQIDYIEDIILLSRTQSPVRQDALTGVQMAYFASLWTTLAGHEPVHAESDKTARVRQLVASRLGHPDLSVAHLAGLIGCHPDYLSHLFKQESGSSLTQYIHAQRIHQARDLLERTALSIKETAAATGYRDPGYFIRCFRRLTGTTPAAYRQSGTAHRPETAGRPAD